MPAAKSLRTQRAFFDHAAASWATRPFDRQKARALLYAIGIKPGDRVIDLGAGTGHLLPLLREQVGPTGSITALDLSTVMLRHIDKSHHRICAAVEALPLVSQRWQTAICMGLYPHFLDHSAALLEIRRLLIPGGQLAIFHMIGRKQLNALHQQIGGPVGNHCLPPGTDVAQTLKTSGFHIEQIDDTSDFFRIVATRSSA